MEMSSQLQLIKKHIVLIGIIISLSLLVIATYYYPGGSQSNVNSIGFNWKNNYLSNLFSNTAVNGQDNASRPWAVGGMFFLCISFAISFWQFSRKIPIKSAAMIVKYVGVGSMLSAFLVVIYHNAIIIISGTGALLAIFYITVFILKSKLFFMKILSVGCLLLFYSCNFMYYSQSYLVILPIMQKIFLATIISWIVGLEYFTQKEDFEAVKKSI